MSDRKRKLITLKKKRQKAKARLFESMLSTGLRESFWNEESPPGNPERQSDADEAHTPEPEENERSTE